MAKDSNGVLTAKTTLGEAGPVWWEDDAPDYSGQYPSETPYKDWWDSLSNDEREAGG